MEEPGLTHISETVEKLWLEYLGRFAPIDFPFKNCTLNNANTMLNSEDKANILKALVHK
jgi:hypothetical protein